MEMPPNQYRMHGVRATIEMGNTKFWAPTAVGAIVLILYWSAESQLLRLPLLGTAQNQLNFTRKKLGL